MKRSIIAVAALLLLASSATYAAPLRRPRFFLGPVLWWLGVVHHERTCMTRPYAYGRPECVYVPEHWQLPPWLSERPYYRRGLHWSWQNGRHNGRDRYDPNRGDRQGRDRPRGGEHQHGREGDRG